jgi:hypothetical protein
MWKTETVLCGDTNTDTETITHKTTVKPRLPKYDSQSETTNDTCLWLRTILGRTQNNNLDTQNIECPPNSRPDQLKQTNNTITRVRTWHNQTVSPEEGTALLKHWLGWPIQLLRVYIQWGKKVFSQPPIVQVLPLEKIREACNFHHWYTSTMTDKMRRKKIQKITL